MTSAPRSPRCINSQHALPGSTPSICCTWPKLILHSSRTVLTLLITYLMFLSLIPGKLRNTSSAAALIPAPASGSSSAPTAIAFLGSGSGLFSLRSLKICALAYGDEDHMIRTRGKDSVSRAIFDWMESVESGSMTRLALRFSLGICQLRMI